MGHLFPVNNIDRTKSEYPKVEKIEEDDRDLFSKNNGQNQHELEKKFSEIDDKVEELMKGSKILTTLGLITSDKSQTEDNLLEVSQFIAAAFLKKEILNIAKSIFHIVNPSDNSERVDTKDLTLADVLTSYITQISKNQQTPKKESSTKYGKAYPSIFKSSGFLVHFCKEILDKKTKLQKHPHTSEKLNKKDLLEFLSKSKSE